MFLFIADGHLRHLGKNFSLLDQKSQWLGDVVRVAMITTGTDIGVVKWVTPKASYRALRSTGMGQSGTLSLNHVVANAICVNNAQCSRQSLRVWVACIRNVSPDTSVCMIETILSVLVSNENRKANAFKLSLTNFNVKIETCLDFVARIFCEVKWRWVSIYHNIITEIITCYVWFTLLSVVYFLPYPSAENNLM